MQTPAVLLVASLLIGGCAVLGHRANPDAEGSACVAPEGEDGLADAESGCLRSLARARGGALAKEETSRRLYDLGYVERRLGRLAEAEASLKRSLAIEQTLSPAGDPEIARRCVELATTLARQKKWTEGASFVERSLPGAGTLTGRERDSAVGMLGAYATELHVLHDDATALRFEAEANALRAAPITLQASD